MIVPRESGKGIRAGRARSTSRTRVAATALVAFVSSAAVTAVAANLNKLIPFDIKAKTLNEALQQYGMQTNLRISFSGDLSTTRLLTHEIKGKYTAKEALAKLLQGTRLRYVAKARTIEILTRPQLRPSPAARAVKALGSRSHPKYGISKSQSRQTLEPSLALRNSRGARSAQALGEIVVTAQKFRQTAFDVPISLQVLSGSELLQHAITNLNNLQYDVPGLYMNSTGISQQVFLRGVGNDFGSGAMVGEYIDDADITAESVFGGVGYGPGDNELYDLKRVEVLKGPQGTLYGDGSMGGVIRYITNKPDLEQFQMASDVTALMTQYGAPSQRIDAMLNTPLINGTLGLRMAGTFAHDGGWVDEPEANLNNINGGTLADVRTEALWQPADSVTVNAMQIVRRHTYGLGTGENAYGDITPVFGTALVPHAADSDNTSNVRINYMARYVKLTSSSTYLKEHQDTDDLSTTEPVGQLTYSFLVPRQNLIDESFSQELRLASASAGRWQWTLGAFYKSYSYSVAEDEYYGLANSDLSSTVYDPDIINVRGKSQSIAEFANSSYKLWRRVTLGAGVRYFRDRETSIAAGNPFSPVTFTSTDPRAYIQYRFSSEMNAYVSASKGFRSGGFNYLPTLPTYGPETLWSYDLGVKLRHPQHNVLADVDVFYSNYSRFVSVTDVPAVGVDLNVGDARIRGVDADMTWRPVSRWRLSLNTEILSTRFLTATAVSGFAAGERLPYAPNYSFTTTVAREFRWNNRPADVEVYYYEISRVQYREAGFPLMQSDILRFLNARTELRWTEKLRLGLFVHNILNDRGFESPFGPLFDESVRPRPRTFGAQFDVLFD